MSNYVILKFGVTFSIRNVNDQTKCQVIQGFDRIKAKLLTGHCPLTGRCFKFWFKTQQVGAVLSFIV